MLSSILKNHKLIIAIVKKGVARKVVQASKKAGAEGGTTLMAIGTGIHDKGRFLGIPIAPEKELVLTLVCEEKCEEVFKAMCDSCSIQKPAHGIAMLINVASVTGICHQCEGLMMSELEERRSQVEDKGRRYDLIVTIVNKGDSELAVEASKKAGARGGTIIFGRGTGVHEQTKLFGITIEPEKEIVLTLIERHKCLDVLEAIVRETGLQKPGKGIAFILNVEKVTGISEIDQLMREHEKDEHEKK